MAVIIDAWAVVARRSAIEDKLPGGIAGWFRDAPNRMACVDRALCCVGFMHEADALAFAGRLERHGLRVQEGGAFQDVAIAHASGPMRHACSWLEVGRYGGVMAAWLRGADPDPLVVPLARRGPPQSSGRTDKPAVPDDDAERRFQRAAELVEPFLTDTGLPPALGFFERRRLRKGIRALEVETAQVHERPWRVWWLLGMARRSNRDPQGAYEAFKRAYDVNPSDDAIGREYAGQCLAVGKGKEAVAVSLRNCELHPQEAGLRSNLALAFLVAGDVERARAEVGRALEMQPDDRITTGLARFIEEVLAGKRERPQRFPW